MYHKALISSYIAVPVLCFAIYLHGFFPIKSTLSGHAELKNVSLGNKILSGPAPLFDKLVIVLIDALRSDFIIDAQNNGMAHVVRLISENKGVAFEVKAHPPTVTLPRIKAITTGTIPGFIDVVLNFDSSQLEEDNLISQLRRAGRRLVFYGDDTWLKLFPQHFVRSDGTTSFFVSDYTEVDDNVTRHLESELSSLDWDLMILHYLGLDHIGHLEGPYSPLVAPKLLEMDSVIQRIYTALEKQSDRSLILVCGDHGMSDHGGHGGASDKETLVPALFISPQFKTADVASGKLNRNLLQIDLAPTLSVLMGLPIPNNNLGQILHGVLEAGGVGLETILDFLYINSLQVVQLMEANIPSYKYERSYQMFVDVSNLHKQLLDQVQKSESDMKQLLYLYETTLEALTDRLSSSLTEYGMYQLIISPVVMFLALVAVLLMIVKTGTFLPLPANFTISTDLVVTVAVYLLWHLIVCSSASLHSKTMCGLNMVSAVCHIGISIMLMVIVASLKAVLGMKSTSSKEWYPGTSLTKLLLAGSVLHSLTYVSSSNIEEEHQTCYFFVTTFFCLSSVKTLLVYLCNYWKMKHTVTRTCACGEITFQEVMHQQDCGICAGGKFADKTCFNEIKNQIKPYDTTHAIKGCSHYTDKSTNSTASSDQKEENHLKSTKVDFPSGEFMSSIAILLILRFLRSLNQTGNKWLDRPDIGDWLGSPEHKFVLTIVSLAALLALWGILARKYSATEIIMVGIALLSCYRYRAKTGSIDDFLNQIGNVDKKYIGTIQFMIIYGLGFLLILRSTLNLLTFKISGNRDEEVKTKIIVSIIESVQQTFIMIMAILLRTHNILYVLGLGCIEMLIEEMIPSVISLPVPYLTMICLWLGRASFFYQGNSNSLSTIDVAAGYAGVPHYQATVVTIQLSLATYAGPIFWFIVLLKYIYLRSLHCDTDNESQTTRLKRSLSMVVMTLVLERLFTLLLYTTVTTAERYHLFVWTVFSPKLLYEGMFSLLSAMVSFIFLSLQ